MFLRYKILINKLKFLPVFLFLIQYTSLRSNPSSNIQVENKKIDSKNSIKSEYLEIKNKDNKFIYWEKVNDLKNKSSNTNIIKWKKIIDLGNKNSSSNIINWEKITDKDTDFIENSKTNYLLDKNIEKFNNYQFSFDFLSLGMAVPTAYTLNESDFNFIFGQVFPIRKGFDTSTSNQNYLINFNYGKTDRLMLSGYFSDSDDPLHNKILNLDNQPANKWNSYGLGSRWNILNRNKLKISLDKYLENWYVKSGGCNGVGCKTISQNIFDKTNNIFAKNNLISSISIPITWKVNNNTDFTLSPKIVFLPSHQTSNGSTGKFYGLNYGLGLGVSHDLYKRFKIYSSVFFPIGESKNSFDNKLNFHKSLIYSFGLNYALDSKISFRTYLTNSFGSSPGTGILTIPSDNEILFGSQIIYTPSAIEIPIIEKKSNEFYSEGLTVSKAGILNIGDSFYDFTIDNTGSYWVNFKKGISSKFNFIFNTGIIKDNAFVNEKFSSTYLGLNNQNFRVGGKALLLSEKNGDKFSSSIIFSGGRSFGDSWPGYFFAEVANTKKLTNSLEFNLNPKFAFTGTGNPSTIGTGFIYKLNNKIYLIPETNIGLNEANTNFTFALRLKPNRHKYVDIYTSNAYGLSDLGEILKSKSQNFGIRIGLKI